MSSLASRFPTLAAFLDSPERDDSTLLFEQALGFLFAVASAPEPVEPESWMPVVLGVPDRRGARGRDEARAGKSAARGAGRAHGAGAVHAAGGARGTSAVQRGGVSAEVEAELLSLFDLVDAQVSARTPELPEDCRPHPAALCNLEPGSALSRWAQGFAEGHEWLADVWDEYMSPEVEDEVGASMIALSFFGSRELAQAYVEASDGPTESLGAMAKRMRDLIPDALVAYADIGRTLAETYSGPREPARREPKVGRNDPCPCGSGRKYKKCCGAPPTDGRGGS
jgi:uncharacterized protein YecA (UPF0149 family)